MNLNHVVVEDIVFHYATIGIDLRKKIEECNNEDLKKMYLDNMKELLKKSVQEHNNIVARTEMFVNSSSISDEDDINKMRQLFMDKMKNKTEYESICLTIEYITKRIDDEAYTAKIAKLASKEVLSSIDESIQRIGKGE